MCSSMEDTNPKPMKSHKLNSEVQTHHANPSKLVNNFLFKATIFTVFLVILPLLPSILPEFINLNLSSRSWELLQLVCVGIAVTYGLFSKKNDGNHHVDKENHNYSLFDNANSYITRLLQVSSVFDDEVENHPSVSDDDNKIQTWSSQYYREEPISMVAKESSDLEEQTAISSRINEKPLYLPVRSLKNLVSESNAAESSLYERSGLNNLDSKQFSRKSVRGDDMRKSPQKVEEKLEEKIVHPSPIPWRSRSGRMEMKLEEDSPLMEDFDLEFRRSNPSRLLKSNSSQKNQPTLTPYVASESKREIFDDSVRRKIHYPKSSPPPAPPPPPPSFLHNKPPLLKSKSGLSQDTNFIENELSLSQLRKANSESSEQRPKAQSVRPNWKELAEKVIAKEVEKGSLDRLSGFKKESSIEYHKEEEKIVVETDEGSETDSENEEDGFEGSFGKYESDCEEKEEALINENENVTDHEGPDVDKKADEFIAKFREQIRLQRIESIRRSTDQHSRNHSR